MKQIFIFLLATLIIPPNLIAQKSKKTVANSKVSIKTEADTISYAYGATLAEQGIKSYLLSTGVTADTAAIRQSFESKISKETDPSKKIKLEKELTFKLDSASKQNNINSKLFFEGMSESIKASNARSAYYKGVGLGSQFTEMIRSFSDQLSSTDKNKKIDLDLFLSGFLAFCNGEKLLIENSKNIIDDKTKMIQEKIAMQEDQDNKTKYADKIEQSREYMKNNAQNPNIVSLPSGLQYEVISMGTGAKPNATDEVKVHYTGMLTDGTTFDSSVQRGEPISFKLSQVIKGWTEGLQLMPVGSKWKLYIPYELGYGSRDMGVIPPYSNLIFEIELLDIMAD